MGRRGAQVLCCLGALVAAASTAATVQAGALPRDLIPLPPPPPPVVVPPPVVEVRLPASVKVAGVDVGGMTGDAAMQKIRSSFDEPLALLVGTTLVNVEPARLGALAEVEEAVEAAFGAPSGSEVVLKVQVPYAKVRSYVDGLAKRFDRQPVDATVRMRGGRPWVSPDKNGRALKRRTAVFAIRDSILKGRRLPLALGSDPVRAKVTRKNFGSVVVIHRGSRNLKLYAGSRLRRTFRIAVGQPSYPTPLGRFEVRTKWRNPWWFPPASPWAAGASPVPPGRGNPLGTRWMGINNTGVGIHGTPSAGSIGTFASHGCIRMYVHEAEWLFDRVAVGTPVFVIPA